MRFTKQTPDQVVQSCLRNSSLQQAADRVDYYLRLSAEGSSEGPEACTPGQLSAKAVLLMQRLSLEMAATADHVTGGAFDIQGAREALEAIKRRAEMIALAVDAVLEKDQAIRDRANLAAAEPVGSA